MKQLTILILISILSSLAFAQEFQFKFTYKGESWTHPVHAENWTAALDKASNECLNHFAHSSGTKKIRIDQESADDLLYTCVNPR
jgi:hypothetical protein